jgi:hypothetical protein
VIFAPAPDLCEVFVVDLDPKTDARPAQKIEKRGTAVAKKVAAIAGIPDISVWFSDTPALPRPVNPFLFRVAPPVH